jgi:uroporphyrinogen decarboxylase
MTPRERLRTALRNEVPDRLPVTTHHLMDYFLKCYMGGASREEFFAHFGLDPIHWTLPLLPPTETEAEEWRTETEVLPSTEYRMTRVRTITPSGTLTATYGSNEHTSWLLECPIKEKRDIEILAKHLPTPRCDVEVVKRESEEVGESALVRGCIPALPGQSGCWQDAAYLYGVERLILEAYDDPGWVGELLGILRDRKLGFCETLHGAPFDVLEHGGGDASSTVISPDIFDRFVAPFDEPIIAAAHAAGQKVVYHTCGGMMPFLERLADMGPDAIETLTPPAMGGDADLAEAKRRVGDRVALIGGWDQHTFFVNTTEEATRAEVRRCFEAAGEGGGFILCPSDHFFDADPKLIAAWADEARKCVYA